MSTARRNAALAHTAIPALEAIVIRHTKIGMCIGDVDEELRADENLAEAATAALAHLTPSPSDYEGAGG
jgi:hypothetical protein